MRVEWLAKKLKNLEDEANYIALENPKAADDFSDAIFSSVDRLAQFPSMGREGRVKHTREWAVPNWSYLIPYRVRGDRLQILGVFHTRQRGNARKTCLSGTQEPFLINCAPFASLTQIPHVPTNRPTLPPLLRRPHDGLD